MYREAWNEPMPGQDPWEIVPVGGSGLVSRIRQARYVAFGLKYPIHAAAGGRGATHASLRSDTSAMIGQNAVTRAPMER
jgi:hypothetical protein